MIVLSIFFCLCLCVCCHFLFGNFFAISMNTRSKFCSKAKHATIFTVGFQYFISRFLLPESLKTKTYAFDVKNLFYSLKPNYSFETSLLHKNPLFYNNRNMGSFRFISQTFYANREISLQSLQPFKTLNRPFPISERQIRLESSSSFFAKLKGPLGSALIPLKVSNFLLTYHSISSHLYNSVHCLKVTQKD